jgi:hypothetical protein
MWSHVRWWIVSFVISRCAGARMFIMLYLEEYEATTHVSVVLTKDRGPGNGISKQTGAVFQNTRPEYSCGFTL